MASENFNVQGLKELQNMLEQLPIRIEKNIMRGALRAGANVMRNAARQEAPVDDGTLKKSIKTTSPNIKKGDVTVRVETDLYYARMIEFGTASYYTGNGRTVGKHYKIPKLTKGKRRLKKALNFGGVMVNSAVHPGIKPQPFMRRAFDGSSSEAVAAFAQYVATRLDKEIKKS